MRDAEYVSLPKDLRDSFLSESVYYPEEHSTLYESDSTYRDLYSAYRKAKKDLEEYKFKKRHGPI